MDLELIIPPRLQLVINEILKSLNNRLLVGGIFGDLGKTRRPLIVLTVEF